MGLSTQVKQVVIGGHFWHFGESDLADTLTKAHQLCTMYPMNQWGGSSGAPSYNAYQQPQLTGGMPMQMQSTGMPMGIMPNASFIQRPPAPPPPPPNMMAPMSSGVRPIMGQPTGMSPMLVQSTGMPPMMNQSTGLSPMMGQPTGMSPMMSQPTGMSPMMGQPTGLPLAAQTTGAFSDPRMRLMYTQFLPAAQPYSGVPTSNNMNFHQGSLQPAQFQSKLQTLTQQQPERARNQIPWTMSKEERKSYDNIFRAWDAKRTGWISGDVAKELFGQSGLSREQLLQIWHLSDSENRGKLNIAEFHIAMALIYRALNGNEIPQELPLELIPSSTRDLSDSVDFLKDLLKQDTSVRNSTALNLAEPGSNKDIKYKETRSFYRNPIEREETSRPSDAVAYKHQESDSAGYRSRSRYLDRREVRFDGQSAAEGLGEMKRQLEKTQRMLERTDLRDEEDHDLQNEMEDVRYAIRRLQDDIEYYNRREGPHAGDQRRKAERTLMQLLHERLPQLEKRLERRQTRDQQKDLEASRQRDARNNDKYAHLREPKSFSASLQASPLASQATSVSPTTLTTEPSDNNTRSLASTSTTASATAAPPKLSGPEREAWIRSEAQRRVQERMRMLGLGGSVEKTASVDASVEQRLAAERSEAEARAAQADKEAKEREEARKARMRENKQVPSASARSRAQPPPPPARSNRPATSQQASSSSNTSAIPAPQPRRMTELELEPEPEPEPEPKPEPKPESRSEPHSVSSNSTTNPFLRLQGKDSSKPEEKHDIPKHELQAEQGPVSKPESFHASACRPNDEPSRSAIPMPSKVSPSLPPAQRATSSASTSSSSRGVHLPPSQDEDWEEEDEGDDEYPMSSRATRQHLAQQLFSGVVPTPEPATSVPEVPPAPPAPAAPPAPHTSAVTTSSAPSNLGGGMGDRNALLSQIRGGHALKKTATRDRSGALTAGSVLGSASPPRGLSTASVPEPDSSDDEEPERADPMHVHDTMVNVPGAYDLDMTNTATPTHSKSMEPQETLALPKEDESTALGFDTGRVLHFRSLYPFEGGEGMLAFEENQVFLVHPTLNGAPMEGDWTFGALLSDPSRKGLIPAAYVTCMEQGT